MIRDCYVIAELGVNWRNLHHADKLIRECAWAGADAVKFQLYSKEQIKDSSLFYLLEHIRLKESDIRYLYWRCRQHEVDFMCTPMFPDAVNILEPYVSKWKIRYDDRGNKDIIGRIFDVDNMGRDILISSSEIPNIERPPEVKYLYCVREYPPAGMPISYVEFTKFDGASCHWPFTKIARFFVANGAKYLEMHVKDEDDVVAPIDNHVSITVIELKELIMWIRGAGKFS